MNLIRHADYFNAPTIKEPIHIIGTGAVGSHIAVFLTRLGINSLHLWDFDIVDTHNLPNQQFRNIDLNKPKTHALKEQLIDINPDLNIEITERYEDQILSGYVFMALDNIEIRKTFYDNHEFEVGLKAVFDTRIGLDIGQIFSANWSKPDHIDTLISASDFKHEEVEEETTACGTKLTILPTVILAANSAVTNFINFIKTKELKPFITFNSFDFKFNK